MDNLIETVFADADNAHRQHLTSLSYSEHMTLATFYSDVRDAVDSIVEAAIGLDVPPPTGSASPILELLEASYVELKETKGSVCQGDSTLENLFDNLTAVYASTLYRLKRLK